MRLIDADAEIARIEQEIQRIDKRIEQYEELIEKEPLNTILEQEIQRIDKRIKQYEELIEKEPLNTIHNFAVKLEQCYKNKAHCKAEIATLKSYATAYDVDKVVEQLEEKSNDIITHNWASEEDDHFGIYSNGISEGYDRAIEIVKAGLKV